MATKPIATFEGTYQRAKSILNMSRQLSGLHVADDLCRAAVIIAVAGFDRYFTAKFCDVLVPRLKSGNPLGPDLIKRLEKAGYDTEFSLILISESVRNRRARPFRKIRTIVQQSLSAQTTHRDSVIDDLFLGLDLKDLTKNAAKRCGKQLPSLMKLVDLRNAIAHEAHVDSNGKPRRIDAVKVGKQIDDLAIFVRSCDEIIAKRFGQQKAVSA